MANRWICRIVLFVALGTVTGPLALAAWSDSALVPGRQDVGSNNGGAWDRDKTGTSWGRQKTLGSQMLSYEALASRGSWERRGQDSNLRTSYPVTGLANPRFRPLSHLSGRGRNRSPLGPPIRGRPNLRF